MSDKEQMIEKDEKEIIIKKHIPFGIQNIKAVGKGNGKPQYRAEIEVIKLCMEEYSTLKAGRQKSDEENYVLIKELTEQLNKRCDEALEDQKTIEEKDKRIEELEKGLMEIKKECTSYEYLPCGYLIETIDKLLTKK